MIFCIRRSTSRLQVTNDDTQLMNVGRPPKGYVEKRGQYRFRARIRYQLKTHVSPTYSTHAQAEEWLKEFRKSIANDDLEQFLESASMTLEDALWCYIRYELPEKSSESTRKRIELIIANFPWLVRRPIVDITEPHIHRFITSRRDMNYRNPGQPVSNRTINYDIALIGRAFELARTKWGCRGLHNPTRKMSLRVKNNRVRRLEAEEEEALMKAAIAYEARKRSKVPIGAIIKFGAITSMRLGETASLRWENINYERCIAHLPETKNGRKRDVPLSPSAIEVLRAVQGEEKQGPVWGVTYHGIENAWQEVREAAAEEAPSLLGDQDRNLSKFKFHDLRHEAVSRLFENTSLQDGKIALISGHLSRQSLARYAHLRHHLVAQELREAEEDYKRRSSRSPSNEKLPEDPSADKRSGSKRG